MKIKLIGTILGPFRCKKSKNNLKQFKPIQNVISYSINNMNRKYLNLMDLQNQRIPNPPFGIILILIFNANAYFLWNIPTSW